MNTKEVSELRRRWQVEKNAVKRIAKIATPAPSARDLSTTFTY